MSEGVVKVLVGGDNNVSKLLLSSTSSAISSN